MVYPFTHTQKFIFNLIIEQKKIEVKTFKYNLNGFKICKTKKENKFSNHASLFIQKLKKMTVFSKFEKNFLLYT